MKGGWELSVGDKIGYVIVSGSGKLYEKAELYVLASPDEIDVEYYVSKQVVPVASRVIAMFGIAEDELIPSDKPKTLFDFMKD